MFQKRMVPQQSGQYPAKCATNLPHTIHWQNLRQPHHQQRQPKMSCGKLEHRQQVAAALGCSSVYRHGRQETTQGYDQKYSRRQSRYCSDAGRLRMVWMWQISRQGSGGVPPRGFKSCGDYAGQMIPHQRFPHQTLACLPLLKTTGNSFQKPGC